MRWLLVVGALVGCNNLIGVHDFSAIDAEVIDAPIDAGDVEPLCSQISMLADSFTGQVNGVLWGTTMSDYMMSPMGLRLNVTALGTWSSNVYYDLREGSFSISITPGLVDADEKVALEVLSQVDGNGAGFYRVGATLELRRTHSGVVTSVASIPYDSTLHRYLRFRAAGNRLYYEASKDGATYAVLGTSDMDALTFVRVMMTFEPTAGLGFTVTLRDANGGTPHGAACPIDHLDDDFSGNLDKWARRITNNATLQIENGAVRIALEPNGMSSAAALASSTVYDLRGGAFELEIPEMVDLTPAQLFVVYVQGRDARSIFEMLQTNGMLTAAVQRDGNPLTDVASVVYEATAQRWWRIAATQDSVSWEVSPDAENWTPLAVTSQVGGLSAVDVIIEAGGSASAPAGATIDNVGGP